MTSDLSQFIKSKEDLYYILSVEGQLHLPPYDECSMEFMRDVLKGTKKLLHNRDVTPVTVPRLREFNAGQLYEMALNDSGARVFLPEPTTVKMKPISRRFLFNVSHSHSPETCGL